MVNCAAIDCTNRSEWFPNGEVSFHRIPSKKYKEQRKQWIHNIRRKEGTLPNDSGFYICSVHFEDSCFHRDLQVNKNIQYSIFSPFFPSGLFLFVCEFISSSSTVFINKLYLYRTKDNLYEQC